MTMRYCAGCGAARCGTCGARAPSLRKDTQNLARSTGADAGAMFWGGLAAIAAIFWPSIYIHGAARGPCEVGWYGFLGMILLIIMIAKVRPHIPSGRPRLRIGGPEVPSWPPLPGPMPDLRDSGEFEGIW